MTPGGGPDLFGNGTVPTSWKKLKSPHISYIYSCYMCHGASYSLYCHLLGTQGLFRIGNNNVLYLIHM